MRLQSPDAAAARDSVSPSPLAISAEQIASLEENGWLVLDGVLTREQVLSARREADCLEFAPTEQHGTAVRTDEVRWIRDDAQISSLPPAVPGGAPGPALAAACGRLRSIASQLQRGGFRGFRQRGKASVSLGVPRALQLSRYPPLDRLSGSAPLYRPHLDGYNRAPWSLSALLHRLQHPGQSAVAARQLTAIVYLQDPGAFDVGNDEGGELVLHLARPVRVSPVCGRVVLFDSKSRMLSAPLLLCCLPLAPSVLLLIWQPLLPACAKD
jgi:hypothetical protein